MKWNLTDLPLRQQDLPEGSLSEDHKEVEVGGTDDVPLIHVMRDVVIRVSARHFLRDGRLLEQREMIKCNPQQYTVMFPSETSFNVRNNNRVKKHKPKLHSKHKQKAANVI